jgi:carbon-monoxide dehydrogenase small subunit
MTIDFIINDHTQRTSIEVGDRLIDVLKNQLGIDSLDMDCLTGQCGRCMVFLDARLVYSCMVPAFRANGSKIVTIEGISNSDEFKDIEAGFSSANLVTCGFCTNAKAIATFDLLNRNPLPSDSEILEQMDLISCGCTDPQNMVDAVHAAAEFRKNRKFKRDNK